MNAKMIHGLKRLIKDGEVSPENAPMCAFPRGALEDFGIDVDAAITGGAIEQIHDSGYFVLKEASAKEQKD